MASGKVKGIAHCNDRRPLCRRSLLIAHPDHQVIAYQAGLLAQVFKQRYGRQGHNHLLMHQPPSQAFLPNKRNKTQWLRLMLNAYSCGDSFDLSKSGVLPPC